MEDMKEEAGLSRKRTRDESESEPDTTEKKFARAESVDLVCGSPESKTAEDCSGGSKSAVGEPTEGRRIEEELLDILDDNEVVADPGPAIQGLDSVIKSLEEEIIVAADTENAASEPGDRGHDLGYLLEASDDELGLPPRPSPPAEAEASGSGGDGVPIAAGIVGLDHRIPSFDSFEVRIPPEQGDGGGFVCDDTSDFVALGSLFDHTESCFGQTVPEPDLTWQTEFLPAI